MKKIVLILSSLLFLLVFMPSCNRDNNIDSTVQTIIRPFIAEKIMSDSYVYGVGQETLNADLPNIVAVAVDTVYGMVGGRGGRTGADTVDILKSEILGGIPDLSTVGGKSISFEKFNKAGYKVTTGANIVIAGPITNPGPTALEGTYNRSTNGYPLVVKKVFDGVYIIGNPGGAASVPYLPYLLYNRKSATGGDELYFPVQTDLCHGGLRLVSPSAPVSLTAGEYDAYPPIISSTTPLTFQWKVFEFPGATNSSVHPDAALCSWGHTAVRTFVKQ